MSTTTSNEVAARQVCKSMLRIPRRIPELPVEIIRENSEGSKESKMPKKEVKRMGKKKENGAKLVTARKKKEKVKFKNKNEGKWKQKRRKWTWTSTQPQ